MRQSSQAKNAVVLVLKTVPKVYLTTIVIRYFALLSEAPEP
jgi:hypothetical protein